MQRDVDTETGEILNTAIMQSKYEISLTGLKINAPLTLNEYYACGIQIVGMKNALQWCIGDWIRYGEGRGDWGEMYTQAMSVTQISYESVTQYAWVSGVFEFYTRVQDLSWSHHRAVAGVGDGLERQRLLDLALKREMSSRDLEAYLKTIKLLAPLHSSKSVEWYTPAKYIESARSVLGAIDLDPASCVAANRTVKAVKFYTKTDDGFDLPWYGRVFLNPPYGHNDSHESNQGVWGQKLITEYQHGDVTEAVLLVSANTSERWFQPLWDYPICFTSQRINFDAPEDQKKSGANHGSVLVYFGTNVAMFAEEFRRHGRVIIPDGLYSRMLP